MSAYQLDIPALHSYLDHRRTQRGLSWRGLARETGLPPMTFTRIKQGHPVEGDALLTLLLWLGRGRDLGPFIAPGADPVDCPGCGRTYQPNREGKIRRHDCKPTRRFTT
jgi:hypothetical protein